MIYRHRLLFRYTDVVRVESRTDRKYECRSSFMIMSPPLKPQYTASKNDQHERTLTARQSGKLSAQQSQVKSSKPAPNAAVKQTAGTLSSKLQYTIFIGNW